MPNSDYIFIGKIIPCGFANNDATNLVFSFCFNINGDCSLLDPEKPDYSSFYDAIMELRNFSKDAIEQFDIHITSLPPVDQSFSGDSIISNRDPLHYIGGGKFSNFSQMKSELYQKIFSCDTSFKNKKNIDQSSHLQSTGINEINNFYSNENLPNYSGFKKLRNLKTFKKTAVNKSPGYRTILNKIFKTADNYKKLSRAEFQQFTLRHKSVKDFLTGFSGTTATKGKDLLKGIYDSYISGGTVDIDEIIHNFNVIVADPILGRLFGFIIDFQVNVKKEFLPGDSFGANLDISAALKPGIDSNDWKKNIFVPELRAKFIWGGDEKYALIPSDTRFSQGSVLIAQGGGIDKINLTSYDKTKSEENVTNDNLAVVIDGFTRGIICHHAELYDLIKPITDWPILVNAEELFQGLRVAIGIIKPERRDQIKWYSLTNRNLKASYKGDLFFESDAAEGCVQIDSPMTYLDDDGILKGTISTAVFEYSEGLVTLKSAFAKVNKQTANEESEEQQTNMHDGGLRKSQARFDNNIGIFKYPFNEIQQEADCKLVYDIPEQYVKNGGPKLRFGNSYVVALYYSFANGWSMPLSASSRSKQLSIVDYIKNREDLYTKQLHYKQLESFKPVLLFPTKQIKEDTIEENQPITEKEAHHELVIRSDDYGEDSTKSARHVLPERISLEHAFWFNLLSKPNMSDTESYLWKRKYNCEFHTSDEYDDFIQKKNPDGSLMKNKCSEGCSEWCGATAMKSYYTEDSIFPNHLSHPDILGFKIKLCWQKDFRSKIISVDQLASDVKFGGTKGINPESCLLTIINGKQNIFVKRDSREVDIAVKQGAVLFCQLHNTVDKSRKAIWTGEELKSYENGDQVDYNLPRELKIVHAVKRPLMVPEIISYSSLTPFHQQIEHIELWLKKPGYQQYLIDKNIIANRVSDGPGKSPQNSTIGKIILISHFERLDAYKLRAFLEEITPTGSLELWMRNEVYVDDPDHIVLDPSSPDYDPKTNHIPDKPIQSFRSPFNKFSIEYKIEFTNEVLQQLKNLKKVEWTNQSNPFLAVISKLELQYNLRTRKFEEREYYLKDYSKFKGYFSNEPTKVNEKNSEEGSSDEYALPRNRDVMSNLDRASTLRFKVMVLNNSQPKKPDIAFAITTIQESRTYPSNKETTSVQKGNIITIYLKRGRLSSGKDERVGIVVDSTSIYNDLFKANNWITRVGSDTLSDKYINRNQFLQFGDINIPSVNTYKAEFDDESGIYHFLPQFDIEKQLWKFEVELNVQTAEKKQLHNPFINFSLLHFQPFSINYNQTPSSQDINDFRKDCRFSEIDNSTWCYLLPERKLSVFFDRPNWNDTWGNINLTVYFDFESLHHFKINKDNWLIRTNFVVTIEGTFDNVSWYPVNCQLDNNNDFAEWGFYHYLLTDNMLSQEQDYSNLSLRFKKSSNPSYKVTDPKTGEKIETNKLVNTRESVTFGTFRIRFFEVEWFTDESWDELIKSNPTMLNDDPIDNEKLRVRYVEIVY
jgi:hypothetical protein